LEQYDKETRVFTIIGNITSVYLYGCVY